MSRHATGSNGRETGVADDELAQLSLFALLSAVATETMSVSPWHEPQPDEWSAVDNAIEVKLAPPPMLAAPAASPDGRTRRQTKDALRRRMLRRRAMWPVAPVGHRSRFLGFVLDACRAEGAHALPSSPTGQPYASTRGPVRFYDSGKAIQ